MPDIKDINDIETIILDFYEKVKVDKLLRPFSLVRNQPNGKNIFH